MEDERRSRLMDAVDRINRKHGRYTVRPLAVSRERGWEIRREHLSPRYTTRLDQVLSVKAGKCCEGLRCGETSSELIPTMLGEMRPAE